MVAQNKIVDPLRQASREALNSFSQVAGVNRLPSSTVRRAVQNMSQGDLDMLSREYGVDQVLHLIGEVYGGTHAH